MAPAARLAAPQPDARTTPPGQLIRLPPCDATASGSEAAVVQLARGAGAVFLCAHHFARHEPALLAAGWRVITDNRGTLA